MDTGRTLEILEGLEKTLVISIENAEGQIKTAKKRLSGVRALIKKAKEKNGRLQ